jgi:uncharacterized protein YjiS (DUF1127 family)
LLGNPEQRIVSPDVRNRKEAHMGAMTAAGNLRHAASGTVPRLGLLPLLLRLETWLDRRRSRRALQALTDHALKDIGLTRADLARPDPEASWQGLARSMVQR